MDHYKPLLKLGEVYSVMKGNLQSYRKVTKIAKQFSKYGKEHESPLYYYIKCDKNGLEKPYEIGICCAMTTDRSLVPIKN